MHILMRTAYFTCAVALVGISTAPVAGAKAAENPTRLLDSLVQCQAITEPTQRLNCYDQGMRELQSARAQNRNLFEPIPQHVEFKAINANLESATETAPGTWLLVLSDHSVWRTDDDIRFIPVPGVAVKVVKASLGSFMASIGKERAVRVVRRR